MSTILLVPGAGLEPACPFRRQILNLLCIPFHHPGNIFGAPRQNRTAIRGLQIHCNAIILEELAGGIGIEPMRDGIKIRCLTT